VRCEARERGTCWLSCDKVVLLLDCRGQTPAPFMSIWRPYHCPTWPPNDCEGLRTERHTMAPRGPEKVGRSTVLSLARSTLPKLIHVPKIGSRRSYGSIERHASTAVDHLSCGCISLPASSETHQNRRVCGVHESSQNESVIIQSEGVQNPTPRYA
jgi:hypothetical protein